MIISKMGSTQIKMNKHAHATAVKLIRNAFKILSKINKE
jgi:hypothetical protein